MSTWRTGALWGAAILLAALLAGCDTQFSQSSKTPGANPTSTPAASLPPLAWRLATMPANLDAVHVGFAVSPVDGRIAWVCDPSGSTSADIWQTQDAGRTWHVAGHVSVATQGPGNCTLTPDDLDPHALVATVSWGSGEAGDLTGESFYSADDAAHWQNLPQQSAMGGPSMSQVATLDSLAVGIMPDGLAISRDGFNTYTTSRPDGLKSPDIFHFWMDPSGGTILASTTNNGLWKTSDLGSTWSKVPTSASQINFGRWLSGSGKFLICGGIANPPVLQCSDDLGRTWSTIPSLTETHACSKCGLGVTTQTNGCATIGIAADGSLLASCPATMTFAGASSYVLYRLAPGDSAWTILGGSNGMVWSIPNNGLIWSTPTNLTVAQPYTLQLPF